MARRTKEDALATRQRLLDAAEHVFLAQGVAGTSLNDIAQAAGTTRGAIYWHFRDKADLFAALCQRATSPMDTLAERASEATGGSPIETLRSLCVDALAHLTGDPRTQAVFEIMFHRSELAGELACIAERHDRDCRQARARVESVIARAVAAGELPRDTDTALAVEALYAYLTGLMHGWTLDPASFDLRACAPALVDTFVAGLVARPPRKASTPPPRHRATAVAG